MKITVRHATLRDLERVPRVGAKFLADYPNGRPYYSPAQYQTDLGPRTATAWGDSTHIRISFAGENYE